MRISAKLREGERFRGESIAGKGGRSCRKHREYVSHPKRASSEK